MGSRLSCPDFVGRDEELDLLMSGFDSAVAGQSATILVGGDAGIGKSRLVGELCDRVRTRGGVVAVGGCTPIDDGSLAYGPLVALLSDLGRQLTEADASELLGPLASGLGSVLRPTAVASDRYSNAMRVVDDLAKTHLFEAVLDAVSKLADRAPLVLVFEDLQWADSGTAELLGFLTRNLPEGPVLVIGTYRSDELSRDHRLRPWLVELGRHARVSSLVLDGLDRDETVELIAGILGHLPEWTLVDAVSARAEGNPFFVEELTAARHSLSLSDELQGVILARVDALSDEAQGVLKVAAVAGVPAAHDLVVAAADLDDALVERALAEAVDRQLLLVDRSESAYRFRHGLLREAIHGSLLPGERTRLHTRVAEVLVADPTTGPPDPGHRAAELAAHWWAAGRWSEALESSLSAADSAAAVWVFPEALAHLERALLAIERLPELALTADDRLALVERSAGMAFMADAGQRSIDLAREAIALAEVDGDPATVARCYALLGRNAWSVGDSDGAFEAYRRAVALVPTDPPTVELARVLAEEARGLMAMSRPGEAERRCHEGLAVARAVGARTEEGHLVYTLGCSRALLGFFDEGIGLVREGLAIAEEVANPDDVNRSYMGLSSLLVESGRLEEALAVVFDGAAVGEELWGVRLNGAASNSVEALILLGRFDDADEMLAMTGARGVGACTATPSLLRTMLALRRGRYEDADALLIAADEMSSSLTDVQVRGHYHLLRGELAVEEGRYDQALEEIECGMALAAGTDDVWYRPQMYLVAVRALVDGVEDARVRGARVDVDKARLATRQLVEELDAMLAVPVERGGQCPPRAVALAATCRAEEARLQSSDPDLWASAAGHWDEAGEPYPTAYCRWREAEARLEGGTGRSRAVELVGAALATSRAIGADALARRVEDLARRARIDVSGPGDDDRVPVGDGRASIGDDLGLTPREVEVLAQLAAGRRDAEIAEALFISKKTASVHVSNILRKLDVANRVEAGRIGQAHGLGGSSTPVAAAG